MGKKDNRWYQIDSWARSLLIVGVTLIIIFVVLFNLQTILDFLKNVYSLISPFIWGIALAYLLSLLMVYIERTFLHKMKRKKLKRVISLTLTIVIALVFVVGFLFAIIPQVASGIMSLVTNISGYFDNSEELVMSWADSLGISRELIYSVFGNWEDIISAISSYAMSLLPQLYDISVRVGTGIVNTVITVCFAVYILADLEGITRKVKRFTIAVFGVNNYTWLEIIRVKAHKAFGGFLVGKTIEAFVIGITCFIFMLICRIPHALLISFVIGITDMVPTFGPILGAIPCIFILFIINPAYALLFAIFIIALQQIEGHILTPHILGDALGLPALWTFVAVVFCGAVWGVVGMIVGVPLFAVIHNLITDFVTMKIGKDETDTDESGIDSKGNRRISISKIKRLFSRKKNKDTGNSQE